MPKSFDLPPSVLEMTDGCPITKPKELRAVTQENWNWFAHYIWSDPLPADLK